MRRYGWEVRRTLSVMFGTVFVASLAWSIFQTATHQSYAYFDTRARLWEFALGSLLALALPVLERRLGYGPSVGGPSDGARPWLPLRVLLGWAGLIGMLACGLLVQVEGAVPGWIALWPLGCACLVIGAGRTGTRWGVDHWLSTSILQRLGDMSYALYLVHWPLLVTLMVVQRRATPGLLEGFLPIAVSLRLAWFLTRYVDAPVRRSRSLNLLPGRAALVIAVSVAVGIAPPLAIQQALDQRTRSALAEAAYNNPGAAVLTGASEGPRDADALTIPLPEDVPYDWTLQPLPCRGGIAPHDADLAAACGQSATGEPGKLVMVVGDSRIQQFSAALQPLAAARGYTTAALLKGACPFTLTGVASDCAEWNVRVLSHLLSLKPSAVYLSTTQVGAPGGERMMPGIDEVVHTLTSAGISVIGLRDQPRLPYAPIACVQDKSPEECTTRKHTLYGDYRMIDPIREAAAKPGSFHAIDLTPWVCPDDRCSPVIGNVFVYLDGNHLSQQYAATLAPMLDEQLTASGWQW